MIVNGTQLLKANPFVLMCKSKWKAHGTSYGLSEAGYDIRIKQDVWFTRTKRHEFCVQVDNEDPVAGKFTLASAIEEFQMPNNLVGVVHDKSTWARRGLSVFNTVIEPGWKGFLTLELVYHGHEDLHIKKGSGIAQVLFHQISEPAAYDGKYQNQENKPVEAKQS